MTYNAELTGRIGPLTPSEGVPSAGEVALFYGLPLVVCGSMYVVAMKTSEKIFAAIMFALILTSGGWILSISYRGLWT